MKFFDDLQAALRAKFPAFTADNILSLEACPAGQEGDFTINCFNRSAVHKLIYRFIKIIFSFFSERSGCHKGRSG